MKKADGAKTVERDLSGDNQIAAYSEVQSPHFQVICDVLCELIDKAIPKATARVWHGSPVWFIDENPIVGYNVTAKSVNLLFWNGQAFEEAGLKPVGKYRAAQAVFTDVAEIDPKAIRRRQRFGRRGRERCPIGWNTSVRWELITPCSAKGR